LPPDAVLVYNTLRRRTAMSHYFDCGLAVIEVSKAIRAIGWKHVAMEVLHEMAHVSVILSDTPRGVHGKNFQREMKRLAAAGAFEKYW